MYTWLLPASAVTFTVKVPVPLTIGAFTTSTVARLLTVARASLTDTNAVREGIFTW
ncbi:hypothetical protein D3C75_1342830 [compost metagenome]